MIKQKTLVFTDLDGTLLDHYNYSSEAALPTIWQLQSMQIPIIPTTSKTFAEVSQLVLSLNLNGPIIVENGAAIYLPISIAKAFNLFDGNTEINYQKISFTERHAHWMQTLNGVAAEFGDLYTSFTALGVEGIVEATGLCPEDAKLAAQREYGEPVVWHGSNTQKAKFIRALTRLGANPVEGGRFIHVCGNCSKGAALTWLADQYQQHIFNAEATTIALGDGNNDIAMLEVASIAVRVRSPSHPYPSLKRTENTFSTHSYGPEGWVEAINHIFSLN